jgi:hypothetical protein
MDEAATQEDGMVFALCVAVRFQSDNYIDAGQLSFWRQERASTRLPKILARLKKVTLGILLWLVALATVGSIQEHELRTWHTAPMEQEYFPSLEKCFSGEANLM